MLTIRMRTADVAEILLYDQIGSDDWFGGGISAKTFREQVKAVKARTINLRINSPGGSVTEAAAMLAALDEHPARIEVDIDGLAASAASVVAMAGKVVRVATNGLVMVHNPRAGMMGDANDMRRVADLLDTVREQILDTYLRRAKLSREAMAAAMDAETWYTGQQAVDVGLADSVSSPVQMAACADPATLAKLGYRHVPPVLTDTARREQERLWEETRKRRRVIGYSEDQERDEQGRFGSGGGGSKEKDKEKEGGKGGAADKPFRPGGSSWEARARLRG